MKKQAPRLVELKKTLKTNGLDGAIITNPVNIFYLTGFRGVRETERESILVLAPKATLIAPRLYQNEARKLASPTLTVEIVAERHLMFVKARHLLSKCRKIGFEQEDLKYGEYKDLDSRLRGNGKRGRDGKGGWASKEGQTLIPTKNLVEQMRIIKTKEEIAKIEKAQVISQKAFAQIVKTLKFGQTEEEIAHRLAAIIKSAGGGGLAFESIIASGPNSGIPHHATGKRKIKKGDLLLLDFGAKFQNYHADLSRTVALGKPRDSYTNIFQRVLEAQKKAIAKIRAGLAATDIYHESNNHFKKHKLDGYFLHGLGHGVGLEIHEPPYLRPNLQTDDYQLLTDGMVFSVEPGLYFPWGGIRIEDLVVVKNDRAKVLGRQSPGLIEIV